MLRVTILFVYAAINFRIPAIMEHPRIVEGQRQVASSRLLPELLYIMGLPSVTIAHFDQCMLGQIWIKPTTI